MSGALASFVGTFNGVLANPAVRESLEKVRFVFDREDAVKHHRWKPTGDWVADAPGAWAAAWDSSILKSNGTHSLFKHADGNCTFQATQQMWPGLAPLYAFPELDASAWDSTPMTSYFREYYWIPILAVSLYVAVIFGGKLLMSQMRPFDLRWSLALWNLGLSVFSWMGAIRTVPHLLATIGTNGVYFSMCEPACGTFGIGDVGFWTCLFIISKFPELIDTVFIVLRKKPLIFLHWYHHATVLLYCWQSFSTQNSAGIYFIAMNFTVHAIMYGYYALKAVGLWPRFIPSWIITILQLSQMIVGIVVSIMTYKFEHVDKRPCSVSYVSATSGAIMYFTYFILFLQILAKTLTKGMPKKSNKKKIE